MQTYHIYIPTNYRQRLIEKLPEICEAFYSKDTPEINTKITINNQMQFIELAYELIITGIHSAFDRMTSLEKPEV